MAAEVASAKPAETVAVEIKQRWTGAVLFTAQVDASIPMIGYIKAAVEAAVRECADLRDADLSGAYLSDADLSGADLSSADLSSADLSSADLRDANLRPIRADLFDVLLRAIPEVPGLLAALRDGRINGSAYTGACACLIGTLANVRGVNVGNMEFRDPARPAERWFLAIREGDTPETSPVARITEGWIVEFLALVGTPAKAAA